MYYCLTVIYRRIDEIQNLQEGTGSQMSLSAISSFNYYLSSHL